MWTNKSSEGGFPLKLRLLNIFETIRTSFWFIPTVMALLATALAFFTVHLDYGAASPGGEGTTVWIWSGGPEGAREVLSVIAASMITVAGVVFSITIVALALASNQYGPRLLRRFMRDTGDQVVLGTFISAYLYCLLVLRMIRSLEHQRFVPHISVTVAVVFAIAGVCVLIYFIHHVSVSIHVENLTSGVAYDLLSSIDEIFPDKGARNSSEGPAPPCLPPVAEAQEVISTVNGYIQAIENERMVMISEGNDLLVCLLQHPGNFISAGTPIARVWSQVPLRQELKEELSSAFIVGRFRTPTQDVDYSIHQLVEIAVRALSPSLNDPFTAVTCLDWLGAALTKLAHKKFPSPYRYDRRGVLRLVVQLESFPHMMDTALEAIRHYGKGSPVVLLRLMKIVAAAGAHVSRPDDINAVLEHARSIMETAEGIDSRATQAEITNIYQELLAKLQP